MKRSMPIRECSGPGGQESADKGHDDLIPAHQPIILDPSVPSSLEKFNGRRSQRTDNFSHKRASRKIYF
jgi:hypothetical protein